MAATLHLPHVNGTTGTTWMQEAKSHLPEYLCEGTELGLFMLSACVFGTLLEHPASTLHQAIASPLLRRVLMGCAMALTALSIMKSTMGKRSGAHFNPAVTLAYWRLGKIATVDATFYVLFQFLGGVLGVAIAHGLLGLSLADTQVRFVVTLPGLSGAGVAFWAEIGISFVLMWTVLTTSNSATLSRLTPYCAAALVALFITFEAPLSGMSMNPARTFGSAAVADIWDSLWIYFTAPPAAMLLAATLFRTKREVYCAKLDHHSTHRCIFRCRFAELGA